MRRLLEWNIVTNKEPKKVNTLSYIERLQKLIDYHTKQFPHKAANSFAQVELKDFEIETATEDEDTVWFDYKETTVTKPGRTKPEDIWVNELNIKYDKKTFEWTFDYYMNDLQMADDKGELFNNLLDHFVRYGFQVPVKGSKEYEELRESLGSIAEDFETYNNLWSEEK